MSRIVILPELYKVLTNNTDLLPYRITFHYDLLIQTQSTEVWKTPSCLSLLPPFETFLEKLIISDLYIEKLFR